MNLKDAKALAAAIKLALGNAARHGGASSDRGLGMRYAAYDVANETFFEVIRSSKGLEKHYPDRDAWMTACGFER